MRHILGLLSLLFSLLGITSNTAAQLAATAQFEGGSAIIESIDQETLTLRMTPAAPADRGWACWWYVKVTGITKGQSISIDLGPNATYRLPTGKRLALAWAQPQRAAFSTDGRTWQHTDPGKRKDERIRYTQQIDANEAWFAWGPPFTPTDADALVKRTAKAHDFAQAFELCKTRENRPVPALRIHETSHAKADDADAPKYGIWINARQHAWESGSSWVCAGLVDWLVSEHPRATSLRRKAEIIIVPIMDIDNTAIGAGGKEQLPHDHNRDWSDDPYHTSVNAAQEKIVAMHKAGRFDLFLDLHNPAAGDRSPFYFVVPDSQLNDTGKRNLSRFIEASIAEITGPLKINPKTRASGANYDRNWTRISKNWVQMHTAEHVVSVTLETSWDTPHSTIEGYKTVGRQQGLALERYFRESPR